MARLQQRVRFGRLELSAASPLPLPTLGIADSSIQLQFLVPHRAGVLLGPAPHNHITCPDTQSLAPRYIRVSSCFRARAVPDYVASMGDGQCVKCVVGVV
jgi:hypothetical protein